MSPFRPNSCRGTIVVPKEVYGSSELGAPLYYFPPQKKCSHLFIAGIHGEEPETTFLLSRVLRFFQTPPLHVGVVLCANPDGMIHGTRGNARGVDLNRNFPASNWSSKTVYSRLCLESPRETALSPGEKALSEPETIALCHLIKKINPECVVSLHAPLNCIDARIKSKTVLALQHIFALDWGESIGYETPGSLGSWCDETQIECVTVELPRVDLESLEKNYAYSLATYIANL